jgi:hypothetical protein
MNRPDDEAFDTRMRRHLSGIDTSPAFEARLAACIAAVAGEPAEARRSRVERERDEFARRLRRETWTNAATAAGIGAAALAVVWRHAPVVADRVEGLLTAALDPNLLGGVAVAVLAAGLWPVLQRYLPR